MSNPKQPNILELLEALVDAVEQCNMPPGEKTKAREGIKALLELFRPAARTQQDGGAIDEDFLDRKILEYLDNNEKAITERFAKKIKRVSPKLHKKLEKRVAGLEKREQVRDAATGVQFQEDGTVLFAANSVLANAARDHVVLHGKPAMGGQPEVPGVVKDVEILKEHAKETEKRLNAAERSSTPPVVALIAAAVLGGLLGGILGWIIAGALATILLIVVGAAVSMLIVAIIFLAMNGKNADPSNNDSPESSRVERQ